MKYKSTSYSIKLGNYSVQPFDLDAQTEEVFFAHTPVIRPASIVTFIRENAESLGSC